MASETDFRCAQRRPPSDLAFGTYFAHGSGKDFSNNSFGDGTNTNFSTVARINSATDDANLEIDNMAFSPDVYINYNTAATYAALGWTKMSVSYWMVDRSGGGTRFPWGVGTIGQYTQCLFTNFMDLGTRQFHAWRYFDNGIRTGNNIYTVGTPFHVACTWDTSQSSGSRGKIYFNGVLQTTFIRNNDNPASSSSPTLCVGSARPIASFNNNGLRGKMYKFMLWENKILTQAEVTELYNDKITVKR